MKLKQATQLGIIGVIILVISSVFNLISPWYIPHPYGQMTFSLLSIIGFVLLLIFFNTLYKNQK